MWRGEGGIVAARTNDVTTAVLCSEPFDRLPLLATTAEEVRQTIPEPTDQDPATRRPNPLLAALAGVVSLGLGYLYVGRPRAAFLPLVGVVGATAVVGWTRLILEPAVFYAAGLLSVLIWLFSIVHPAVIAFRLGTQPARPFNRWWVYVVWIVGFGILSSQVVEHRTVLFGFQPFRMASASMSPTIQRDEWVMVDTWRFRHTPPAINEMVVLSVPRKPGAVYLFRVVGLPGDKLQIRDDVLVRNGSDVNEPFKTLLDPPSPMRSSFGPIVLPADHYLVLGDNRHRAYDSRALGAIHKDWLLGRVEYRCFAVEDGVAWSRFPEKLTTEDEPDDS